MTIAAARRRAGAFTIAELVRRLRRRWQRYRAERRARLAFQDRLRARADGRRPRSWSTSPGGSDVYTRPLTRDEWRQNRPTTTAPRWIDRGARR
jgi:hypothetical protein